MTKAAYQQLELHFSKLSAIAGASAMLDWDSAAMMPDGGSSARAEQSATLGVLSHDLQTQPIVADLLSAAEEDVDTLNTWQQANLREMRISWRHATAVDADLVEAYSRATSASEMQWRQSRANNDFASLVPHLGEVVRLTQTVAAAGAEAFGLAPYDALLNEYEPGCSSADIDILFAELEDFLPEFLGQVLEHQASKPEILMPDGPFALENQKNLGQEFMTALGFDFNHGRLDTSHHPFTGGTPDDVRLTTRYEEDDFTQSLMGTLHETGHALYEQGLPSEWRTQPVGHSRGMALHESQSLLVEMQLSRGPEFLSYAVPKIREAFSGRGPAWEMENINRLYLKVEPGLIRVDADEVTYPLHVMLRYRLEKALLSGDLPVADLPDAWNAGMQDLLGITPPDDAVGCLQDIHWPSGAIGYFPTYTLGALSAAQIYRAAHDQIGGLTQDIEGGKFGDLLSWLRTNVHGLGSSQSTEEIMIGATGTPLGTQAFKAHLQARYLP